MHLISAVCSCRTAIVSHSSSPSSPTSSQIQMLLSLEQLANHCADGEYATCLISLSCPSSTSANSQSSPLSETSSSTSSIAPPRAPARVISTSNPSPPPCSPSGPVSPAK